MWITSLELILLLGVAVLALFYTELIGAAQPDPTSEKSSPKTTESLLW